jgi:hypothetical protein
MSLKLIILLERVINPVSYASDLRLVFSRPWVNVGSYGDLMEFVVLRNVKCVGAC